ncbi:MAG: hypothetical protein NVS1B10_00470 [Candidatus Saccharimonadales bacterium]
MTRFLSESLQAKEPYFGLALRQLEKANSSPGHDIRLSSEVIQNTRQKILSLDLDPNDTTAAELYHVLLQRMADDDKALVKKLRTYAALNVSADADIVDGIVGFLNGLNDSKRCYALKTSCLKSILKDVQPKKAMKQLGYRSFESLLKHESPTTIMTMAWLVEGKAWQRKVYDKYKKLTSKDFEDRQINILKLQSKRWQDFARTYSAQSKHNVLAFYELGTLVILPLPTTVPVGTATASLSLCLHELNSIRSSSSFMKFCQVRPDFGLIVQHIANHEPQLNSVLLDKPVPWQLVQRFYSSLPDFFSKDIFEPHVELADMIWQPIEKTLATIEPAFEFWEKTTNLAVIYDHKPVSMNVLDIALAKCNLLPFEERVVHYFQTALRHELLLRYMQLDTLEQSIISELQPKLVTEKVMT